MKKRASRHLNAAWLSEGALPALLAVLLFAAGATFPRISTAAACAVMPNNVGTGTVTAINAASNAPISGALVNWTYAGHTMRTATDSRGRMAFQVQVANTSTGSPVALSVQDNGYNSAMANATICPGTNTAVRVRLSAVAKFGTVKGQVTDSLTGLGIADVDVEVLIGEFPQRGLMATTGTDGRYSIPRVGFAGGLTLQATLGEPSCAPPIRRTFAVNNATVTENFKVPVTTTIAYCPPAESGDLSGAATRASARHRYTRAFG